MKRAVVVALAAATLLAGSARAERERTPEVAAARQAFEAYVAAMEAGDADRVLELTDAATLAHNEELLAHARASDRAALGKLRMIERFAVLRIRAEIPPEKLARMKAPALVRHGVARGWSKPWNLAEAAIQDVTVKGKRATVRTAPGHFGTALHWQLRRERGAWRVSVVSVLPEAEALLRDTAKRLGKSEDALVELALRMLLGEMAPGRLWDPPKRERQPRSAPGSADD